MLTVILRVTECKTPWLCDFKELRLQGLLLNFFINEMNMLWLKVLCFSTMKLTPRALKNG